jgi:hypothetical protein
MANVITDAGVAWGLVLCASVSAVCPNYRWRPKGFARFQTLLPAKLLFVFDRWTRFLSFPLVIMTYVYIKYIVITYLVVRFFFFAILYC